MINFIRNFISYIINTIREMAEDILLGLYHMIREIVEPLPVVLFGLFVFGSIIILARYLTGDLVNDFQHPYYEITKVQTHRQMYPRPESWDLEYRRDYRIETSRPHR